MHKEELIYLECENGHTFAIRSDENEEVNFEELTCPICADYITTEMNRTVLVATGYKDLLMLEKLPELERLMGELERVNAENAKLVGQIERLIKSVSGVDSEYMCPNGEESRKHCSISSDCGDCWRQALGGMEGPNV